MPDTPRPPFDRLDAMTPPDQWAEVSARLDEAPLVAGPTEVDVTDGRTGRRWLLAAAVAVLLASATGVVLGRDNPSSTVAGPGESAEAGCPFTFLRSADDLLQPSTGELMLLAGTAPGSDSRGRAVQHAVVEGVEVHGDRMIEVDVVANGDEPVPGPSVERVGPTTWLDLYAPVGQPRPGCDLIRVRIDASDKHVLANEPINDFAGDFFHLADFVADVLALTPLDPELVADEPCSFTLDGDPTLGPLAPMLPGDAAPYDTDEPWDLLDDRIVVGGWQRVEVDGNLALVGVGGYGTGPLDEWIDNGPSGSSSAGKVFMTGNRPVAASGWCTDAVVHLIIPLTDEQVTAAEAGEAESEWLDLAAAQATIGRVMDAVRVV